MITPELLIIVIFATYRITSLLKVAQPGESEESGPNDILGKIRTQIGIRYDEYSKPYGLNWRAEALLCFLCLSFWVAIGIGLLLLITWLMGHIEISMFLLLPFGLSGGAIFMKRWAG